MKIGILTFHRAINYGAFLQCVATKQFLESQGHIVEVIDYWPKAHEDSYKVFSSETFYRLVFKPLRFIKYIVRGCLIYRKYSKRKRKMKALQCHYMGIDINVQYANESTLNNLKYDVIIYGSDQIWWNSTIPGYLGYDPVYWGSSISASIKKISYAASMGTVNICFEDYHQLRTYLDNFSSISVRERKLKSTLEGICLKPISLVLDPVFLISKEQWESMIGNLPIIKKPYIVYYSLIKTDSTDMFVKEVSMVLGLPVFEITGEVYPFIINSKCLQTLDAFEFLNVLYNSSFVISTSFHGTAFSVIFEKEFVSIGMGTKSGRVESLLDLLDLSNRLLRENHYEPQPPIDYSLVKNRLKDEINSSKIFLENSLST